MKLTIKKIFVRITAILSVLLIVISVAHAIALPQVTRCYLIDFYGFEKQGDLYFRANADTSEIATLTEIIEAAKERNIAFWGAHRARPTFIYCDTDKDCKDFGAPSMPPAIAFLSYKSFVIISKKGVNLDILAHEISHTELAERIGVLNRTLEIPVWFDEGLAMQIDYRAYYSLDTLAVKSDNYQNLPEVNLMDAQEFWSGSKEEVMLNYMTAKYELSQWHSKERLQEFIEQINNGQSFEQAYFD